MSIFDVREDHQSRVLRKSNSVRARLTDLPPTAVGRLRRQTCSYSGLINQLPVHLLSPRGENIDALQQPMRLIHLADGVSPLAATEMDEEAAATWTR